jgi:hypothetical protein
MWFAISEAGMDPVSRLTNTFLAGGRGRMAHYALHAPAGG